MDYTIRASLEKDFADIVYINEMSLYLSCDIIKAKERFEKLLSNDDHIILVAEYNGKVVGYIHLNINTFLYTDKFFNINTIAVLPKYRNKGIATELLLKVSEIANDVGATFTRIYLDKPNKKARKFLINRGFDTIKLQYNMKNTV